jgi:site-specific recombinase XerD
VLEISASRGRRHRRASVITRPGYRAGMPAPNKGMKLPPEPLSRSDVSKLLAACSTRGSAGIRDRALIAVLYRAGLRVAEGLALQLKDVDLETGHLVVLHGKGNRRRTVGLDPEACAIVERWARRRRELAIPRFWTSPEGERIPAPLFCVISRPNKGKPMYASVFREKLKDLADRAGVERRVHPHGLRHTHAFELATEGVPVHVIRKQLGHTSLATTERYIDHLSPGDVIAAMRMRTWQPEDRGMVTPHVAALLTQLLGLNPAE